MEKKKGKIIAQGGYAHLQVSFISNPFVPYKLPSHAKYFPKEKKLN